MKLYTPFEFDDFTNDSVTDDNQKLEYIKQMISLAQEDKKAVFPYITIALISIAFVINRFDADINNTCIIIELLFYIGIALLISSAVLYFSYWRKIHKCQIQMTSCIPNLNIEKTRNLWIRLWDDNKSLFKIGLIFMIFGCAIVFIIPMILRLVK